MSHSFKSIALVGRPADSRVADCMLSLAGHFHANGLRTLVDPGVALAFPPGPHRGHRRRRHDAVRR
jgi:hypothetical protein